MNRYLSEGDSRNELIQYRFFGSKAKKVANNGNIGSQIEV